MTPPRWDAAVSVDAFHPAGNPSGGAARGGAWLAAVFAACIAAAFWTANGVVRLDDGERGPWHHYEELADGFLHGHTYLSEAPDPGLLRLSDPYDPALNGPYRMWDASLYQGRYYLYYGPAPAVLLMAPWQAITGRPLPQRLAVAAFAVLGLAALARLLWEVRERHFPGVSGAILAGVFVTTAHASWLPVILRRAAFWELPIVAAAALLWCALYFVWRFHSSGGRTFWAAAAGVALAAVLGCRVTYLFTAAVVLAALWIPAKARIPAGSEAVAENRRKPFAGALLGSALVAAGGLALLGYNIARFGKPLEFGQSYQLWGFNERTVSHFSAANVLFNARLYLFSVPTLSPYFPFVRCVWPASFPSGYIAIEEMHGILFGMPVFLAAIAAIAWVRRHRAHPGAKPLAIVIGAAAGAGVLGFGILLLWNGACSRYLCEAAAGWTPLVGIGLLAIAAPDRESRAARMIRRLALAACVWTVGYTWLASIEFQSLFKYTEPALYAPLARTLDEPAAVWARVTGRSFGPVDLDVRITPGMRSGLAVLLETGRPAMLNRLVARRLDEAHVVFQLLADDTVLLETPPLQTDHGRIALRVEAPWLYPPVQSPYWDSHPDPRMRRERQSRLALSSGGRTWAVSFPYGFDPLAFAPKASRQGPPAWINSLRWEDPGP